MEDRQAIAFVIAKSSVITAPPRWIVPLALCRLAFVALRKLIEIRVRFGGPYMLH
ncbi:hypothetical protein COCSUDRAFT_34582 [Coccomyxa subellipsoidea C-169]|uniref:Uncharacterized protein n=1 Tax=Coccomyxa subellipsoidea (strain C-169) TaxID=574566 RepID=I0YIN7_COCSC|nr:hypothetical protein COCSUDRAFT_34582 [Coccomyxa subellipsoidea C-169]EIE18256.1 hypothetical protein COCSUDRAFT_34582 [Coccomyxa subellipsoidea C-169]|eukprot:XP_005642800.1 hypothetical protein COCSUDRAFT_34582 [Coccomyxa subellipsoidea C-169]